MTRKKAPANDDTVTEEPVTIEHPALMQRLAWQKLVKHLMEERGFKHQYAFAHAIGVCAQTMGRWLGKKPSSPEPKSFAKLATYLEISQDELAMMWLSFMNARYAAYQQQPAPASEIREPAAAYDEPDPMMEAKALEGLDLKHAPLEQRPFLHHHRREILELVAEIEDLKRRLSMRLRSMLKSFRDLFQSAADTERKLSRTQGG